MVCPIGDQKTANKFNLEGMRDIIYLLEIPGKSGIGPQQIRELNQPLPFL